MTRKRGLLISLHEDKAQERTKTITKPDNMYIINTINLQKKFEWLKFIRLWREQGRKT